MSHGKERKEKNCLNCNARVFGKYCQVCGQENIEPKETALGFIVHFFNDITHFEGKFITSLRYLLIKPGFLTAEYLRGRRASYMNPVRMYVFTSAFFFILFFSFFSGNEKYQTAIKFDNPGTNAVKLNTAVNPKLLREEAFKKAGTKKDTDLIEKIWPAETAGNQILQDSINTSVKKINQFTGKAYKTMGEYDSIQLKLPVEKRDSWFQRAFTRRMIIVDERYGGDLSKFNQALMEQALHSLPKMLFVSLPLFALILSLLYIRRKQFYYADHLVFTIHLFVFVFLLLLLIFTNNKLQEKAGWNLSFVSTILWLYMFVYLYKAMRRMYQQGRTITVIKYLLLLLMALIINSMLFVGLFSYSFFNI